MTTIFESACWLSSIASVTLCSGFYAGCGAPAPDPDEAGARDVVVTGMSPHTLVPGSAIIVSGRGFVGENSRASQLRLRFTSPRGLSDSVFAARYVDSEHLEVRVNSHFVEDLSRAGELSGVAIVEVESAATGDRYESRPFDFSLSARRVLEPRIDAASAGSFVFLGDRISVTGENFLLGGEEGRTHAVIQGCFLKKGEGQCDPIGSTDIPIEPTPRGDRTHGTFPFSARIAGILPGRFLGRIQLVNAHASGVERASATFVDLEVELLPSAIFAARTREASLGQWIEIDGAGFLHPSEGSTAVHLRGTFVSDGTARQASIDVVLVPEVQSERHLRVVLRGDDALGSAIDLRSAMGTLQGTLTPRFVHAREEVEGFPAPFSLRILAVRQVVRVSFLSSYREGLERFGLRSADAWIRARVLEVLRRDFATTNVEVRSEFPEEYLLYTTLEIAGPDPNGLGLFGYDATPGKDTDNRRLDDRIGGLHEAPAVDGTDGTSQGQGGVFIESFLAFSAAQGERPRDEQGVIPDATFDAIFDPFRADRGGVPVSARDLSRGVVALSSGERCLSEDRGLDLACAVFVLGNLVGSTASHELGHALGLADPYGPTFHNPGDRPNRLMDETRPFLERAELRGQGPSVFCDDEYAYLRRILPTTEEHDPSPRPRCD